MNKYLIRKKNKYLSSIKILNEEQKIFIPKWTTSKKEAFPFSLEINAQIVCDQIDEVGIKYESISRDKFKKGNDPYFNENKKIFEIILN